MKRRLTKEQSSENVTTIFKGVDDTMTFRALREPILGFKLAEDHKFKIDEMNPDGVKAELEKGLKGREGSGGETTQDQIEANAKIRKEISFELMREKIEIEQMVHRNFDELLKQQDKKEEEFTNREKDLLKERQDELLELNRKLDIVYGDNCKSIERIE